MLIDGMRSTSHSRSTDSSNEWSIVAKTSSMPVSVCLLMPGNLPDSIGFDRCGVQAPRTRPTVAIAAKPTMNRNQIQRSMRRDSNQDAHSVSALGAGFRVTERWPMGLEQIAQCEGRCWISSVPPSSVGWNPQLGQRISSIARDGRGRSFICL